MTTSPTPARPMEGLVTCLEEIGWLIEQLCRDCRLGPTGVVSGVVGEQAVASRKVELVLAIREYADLCHASKRANEVDAATTGAPQSAEADDVQAARDSMGYKIGPLPNLWPVIRWLEGGCDPKAAADELRIYAARINATPQPVGDTGAEGVREPSETISVRFDILHDYAEANKLSYSELCRTVRDAIREGSAKALAGQAAGAAVGATAEDYRQKFIDLLQDVLDAKDAMMLRGIARADFPTMFKAFASSSSAAVALQGQQAVALGKCCYGGLKPKSDCASCAAWAPAPSVKVRMLTNEEMIVVAEPANGMLMFGDALQIKFCEVNGLELPHA